MKAIEIAAGCALCAIAVAALHARAAEEGTKAAREPAPSPRSRAEKPAEDVGRGERWKAFREHVEKLRADLLDLSRVRGVVDLVTELCGLEHVRQRT